MRISSTLFFLASLAVSSLASTIADIEASNAGITTQLKTLQNSINAFPTSGGTLSQALTIHTNLVALGSSMNKGATNAKAESPIPVSEADGWGILSSVKAIEPALENSLQGLVNRKAAFGALPVGGFTAIIISDIINLSTSTDAFLNGLITILPADLKPETISLKSRIDAAFTNAINAYK